MRTYGVVKTETNVDVFAGQVGMCHENRYDSLR